MKNIASNNKMDHVGLFSVDRSENYYDNKVINYYTINVITDKMPTELCRMTEEQYEKCGEPQQETLNRLYQRYVKSESNKDKSDEERKQEFCEVILDAASKGKNIVKELKTKVKEAIDESNKKQSMWGGAIAALLGAAVCCLFGTLINNSVVSGDAKICFIFAWVLLGIGVICVIGLLYAYNKAVPGEKSKGQSKVSQRKPGKVISIIIVCVIVIGLLAWAGIGYHNVPYNCDLNGHIDSDGDFYCDECKAVAEPNCESGDHIDKNDNGVCDFCDTFGHQDPSGDGKCDHCGAIVQKPVCEHVDDNNDFICDNCQERVEPNCESGDHIDKNDNGVCDFCDTFGHQNRGDGKCAHCGACLEHIDSNEDWLCDRCGAEMESVVDSNGFKYTLEDGTLAVSAGEGFKGGALVIPSTYQGRQVTAIATNGFNNQTMAELLTSITIPEGIKKIGNNAFAGSGLTKVTIPSTVEVIGEYAFAQSGKLENVTINGAATTLGDHCFAECGALTTISLGANVSALGNEVFSGCPVLETVNYGGTLEQWSLLSKADNWDADTQTIDILCSDAGTDKYEQYAYVLLSDDTYSVQAGLNFSQVEVTILEEFNGKAVTSIAENAFANEVGIESIEISDGITSIEQNAFMGCLAVKSVVIPNSVESMGCGAFSNCSKMSRMAVPFVGEKSDGTGQTHFGHIFGASSYIDNSECVPDTLENLIVTGGDIIGDCAFLNCDNLRCITLSESIYRIGDYAFGNCDKIKNINISQDVTSIGDGAFYGCYNMTKIEFPNRITTIGDYTLYNCGCLTEVAIPETVNSIGMSAFEKCGNITRIDLPDSIADIGDSAFAGCYSLQSITIPVSVKKICDYTFVGCRGLAAISIPSNVASIGEGAFQECTSLASVAIADGLIDIGNYAFFRCDKLTSIIIPNTVTRIGEDAFSSCDSLRSITLPFIGEKAYYANGEYYGDQTRLEYVISGTRSLREVVITGDAAIGEHAFDGLSKITKVVIGNGVTDIGNSAFSGCLGLESITISDSVTSIGDDAFSGCKGLTDISIPENVVTIGFNAFEDCSRIIEKKNGISYVDDWIVACDKSTSNLMLKDAIRGVADGVTFDNFSQYNEFGNALYVGNEDNPYLILVRAKQNDISSCEINPQTKIIGEYAFQQCSILESVTIPNSVISIGAYAFTDCDKLNNVIIGNSVRDIGNYAFYENGNLSDIVLGSGVRRIGEHAFTECSKLNNVEIPDSVVCIDVGAYANCTNLHTVSLGCNVMSIGAAAFWGCSNLKSIYIPNSVKCVGLEAFCLCQSLETCKLSEGLISIGRYAFAGCSSLTSVSIPSGVLDIANGVFSSCSNLHTINIGEGVKRIGESAFSNCKNMTSIVIPDSVTHIEYLAFGYCSGLDSISLGNGIVYIESNAFLGCSNIIQKENAVSYVGDWVVGCDTSASNIELRDDAKGIAVRAFEKCNISTITIPEEVISINEYAFADCNSLTDITMSCNVKWLGNNLFDNCQVSKIEFDGIIKQWQNINKEPYWHYGNNGSITISCIDGSYYA